MRDFFYQLKNNTFLLSVVFLMITFECVSMISFMLMENYTIPAPWSWYFLINRGYGVIVISSALISLFVIITTCLYFLKGLHRWVSLQIILVFSGFLLSTAVGLFVFKLCSGMIGSITPLKLIGLYDEAKIDPILYHQIAVSLLSTYISVLIVIFIYVIQKIRPEKRSLGDAHFAKAHEIKQAGFFNDNGILVGKSWGKALKVGGFEHVLAFAPAGSGKTTSIAIPNLLLWENSCVVNDPKYELFEATSGYRKKAFKNDIFCWAPTRRQTHRYNPLEFISSDPYKRIGEIQLMGHVMIPNGQGEPIWFQSSRELFLALVLYLLDHPDKKATLPEVYALSKQHEFNKWLDDVVENTTDLDPEFYRNASSYLNTAEKTRASILKTFTGYLEIFANPVINSATSASDFDMRDLRRKRMTIYIGFSENEKEMISPLLTLFWQQLISFMTEKVPNEKDEPYPLLCLMEEFSILGRLVNLKSSLKILRGYRVRVLIIIQYLAQTLEYYSRAEAEAFKNIKTKIAFSLDSQEDAEYVSRILGHQTKRITNRGHSFSQNSESVSKSQQLQSVPLMRPSEIQRMKKDTALIIKTGHAPVRAKQYRWYKHQDLKNLPCGMVEVPVQNPIITPFERKEEQAISDEEKMALEELDALKSLQKEQRLHERELEKEKVKATILANSLAEAIGTINMNKNNH